MPPAPQIAADRIEEAAHTVMAKAGIEIPDDYLHGIQAMASTESGDLSAFVLRAMLENWEAAKADRRPMCADTGVPRYYVKIGNEARVRFASIDELAVRCATDIERLDVGVRRLVNPHRYHVSVTDRLHELRRELVARARA